MILEEETFREFGYLPSDWAPKSDKKILAACDDCGKVRVTSKNAYCARCISCSRKRALCSEEARRRIGDAQRGKCVSEETRKKISDASKNPSEETRRKMSDARKGKGHPQSEEAKRKIGEARKGVPTSEETKRKISDANKGEKCFWYGKHFSGETRSKMREAHKNPSDETRNKIGEASKKNWQNPDYIKKVFNGLNAKPNELEKKVGAFLQKHLPDEYAYNGDFSCGITIGGKIPDFVNVNGEKIVIEVFGPWHDETFMRKHFGNDISWKRTEFGAKALYSQFGYKCVIFWQEELERIDAEQFILEKMKKEGVII